MPVLLSTFREIRQAFRAKPRLRDRTDVSSGANNNNVDLVEGPLFDESTRLTGRIALFPQQMSKEKSSSLTWASEQERMQQMREIPSFSRRL